MTRSGPLPLYLRASAFANRWRLGHGPFWHRLPPIVAIVAVHDCAHSVLLRDLTGITFGPFGASAEGGQVQHRDLAVSAADQPVLDQAVQRLLDGVQPHPGQR